MALTKDSSVVTTYIQDKIENNKGALGLAGVWRGEERQLIPEYPAAIVRSGRKRRTLATLRQYEITFETIILVMFGVVGELQITELAVEELADSVENLLHSDRKLGDESLDQNLVYNSWVTAIDPGRAVVASNNIRTTRITWQGQSREVF